MRHSALCATCLWKKIPYFSSNYDVLILLKLCLQLSPTKHVPGAPSLVFLELSLNVFQVELILKVFQFFPDYFFMIHQNFMDLDLATQKHPL